jgi:hypothetical protein
MVALNLGGHPVWAFLAPAAMLAGVIVSAGPLAFLPGTLGGPLAPTSVPGLSNVYFAAPLWWRLIVAAVAFLPFAGAWLLTRRPPRPMALGKTLSAVALFGLVVEVTVLVVPQTPVPDGGVLAEAMPTVAVLLVVGCCAAVASSTGTLRRGAVTAVAVALLGGTAWMTAWMAYRVDSSALEVFGWEQATGTPGVWLGSWQLIALVLAAGALGWAAGAVMQVLAAHRPSGLTLFGHPESPGLPI